ncbi:hypothetical protein AB0F59_26145 [Micromonospora lupini]|uniref:hypothetical protein n=1 Tax=Micromonospora lupini TaxID=285679 RepID=UPI0034009E24
MARRAQVAVGVAATLVLAGTTAVLPNAAEAASAPPPALAPAYPQPTAHASRPEVSPAQRDTVLGKGWRSSTDIAWTTSGDAIGLHILVAKASERYAWHTITTLSEPGIEADAWIGNVCVTGSGRRLAATYAPRTFTNSGALFTRGAFTAVVDLGTGRATKLPLRASLAYYSPGCGIGESVVFTQSADEDSSRTRLVRVDARNGKRAAAVELTGQVTSAVPLADGTIAAADLHRIVGIGADGRRRTLARTHAVPFTIVAGPDGGLTYLDHADGKGLVQHLPRKASRPSTVARGDLTGIDLTRDAIGRAVGCTSKTTNLRDITVNGARITLVYSLQDACISVWARADFAADSYLYRRLSLRRYVNGSEFVDQFETAVAPRSVGWTRMYGIYFDSHYTYRACWVEDITSPPLQTCTDPITFGCPRARVTASVRVVTHTPGSRRFRHTS